MPRLSQKKSPSSATRIAPPVQPTSSPILPMFIIVGLVVACLFVISMVWFKYAQLHNNQQLNIATSSNTPLSSPEQLVQKVSRHILIDTSTSPTIATIQDPELLRQQNPLFYQDAVAGDRLLVWPDKAILYSETKDQLLAILPLVQPTSSTTNTTPLTTSSTTPNNSTAETSPIENPTIEIRNGTRKAGLAGQLSLKLRSMNQFPFNISGVKDAVRKNYPNTLLINRTNQPLPTTMQVLQNVLQAEVTSTPALETNVKGDVLIIIGADYHL